MIGIERLAVAVVLAFLGGALPRAGAAEPPSGGELTTWVLKYVGTRVGSVAGRSTTMLLVTLRTGGGQFEVAIPNNTPASPKLDPNTAAMNVIKELKAGDFVKIRYSKTPTLKTLDVIEKRALQLGDDDPDASEFVKLTEVDSAGQRGPAVVLRKGAKEQALLLPAKPAPEGKPGAAEDILAQARKLTEGDYVDVEVTQAGGNASLRTLRAYQPFSSAVFVKTGTAKMDADTTLVTVELKEGEKSLTLSVRPAGAKGSSDPALVSKVHASRAGQTVIYKTLEEGGKTWLLDIRPAPAIQFLGDVTLNGTFEAQGKTCPLKAVLKCTGPGEWKTTYFFDWNGKQTFTGAIKGNLQNGEVTGTAVYGGRTFGFKGQAVAGVLTFEHFETTGGGHKVTGKGTLK
jgi:hypothetical protein